MDFYTYKMLLYRQNETHLPMEERMIKAKEDVDRKNREDYEKIIDDYKRSLKYSFIGKNEDACSVNISGTLYQEKLLNMVAKATKIASLTPQEYFSGLIEHETQSLASYQQQKLEEFTAVNANLNNLNQNKGVPSKIASILGKEDEMRQRLSERLEISSQTYEIAKNSSEVWNEMNVEEKEEYLLGRLEFEGKSEFDGREMDNFAQDVLFFKKEEQLRMTQENFSQFTTQTEFQQ